MKQWNDLIAGWRAWLIAAGRPDTTVSLRMYQLRRFAADVPRPLAVTTTQLVEWLGSHGWAIETMRSHRAALTGFYRWLHVTGQRPDDPTALLPPISPARHLPRPAPESVVRMGVAVTDRRVRLMIRLAAELGMRRGEIAVIHTDDLHRDLLGWSLTVHGKGGKDRVIPISDSLARELADRPSGWVFPGRIDGHVSAGWVGKLMSRALPVGWTPHTLRHRFATVAYGGTRDLASVQALLGHSRPETTMRYVRLPDDAMRSAASIAWAA